MLAFVCTLLGHRIVTKSDIETADSFLVAFCKKVELLYGVDICTPNMHLHLHLKDCLLDYGPPHPFWCFSFERYNGLLGSFHTNKKCIEVQIMRKFITSQFLYSTKQKAHKAYLSLLPHSTSLEARSHPLPANDQECLSMLSMSTSSLPNSAVSFHANEKISLLSPYRQYAFSSAEIHQIRQLYEQLHPSCNKVCVSPIHTRSGRVSVFGEIIGSLLNANSYTAASVITAYWPVKDGPISQVDTSRMRVGSVHYYTKFRVTFSNDYSDHNVCECVCAFVQWKKQHPQESYYGVSALVCSNEFEIPSMYSFLPVQRIHAIAVHCNTKLKFSSVEERVFIAIPVNLRLSL